MIFVGLSIAQRLAALPAPERERWLAAQSPRVIREMRRGEWWYTARPEQIPPPGDWMIALYMAGRGAGKSRSGSEWMVEQVLKHPYDRHGVGTEWAIIAETLADARLICLEGPSGLLNVLDRKEIKYRYKQSPKSMVLIGDSRIHTLGADDEDVGRGSNLSGVWLDEVCIAKGELIETSSGPRRVEQIKPGDMVLTRSGLRPVAKAQMTAPSAKVVRLVTEARSVRVTPTHRVWVEGRGWTFAKDVRPGDSMLTRLLGCEQRTAPTSAGESPPRDIRPTLVLAVEKKEDRVPVYDLEVDGEPEFFAGGLLVHNCKWLTPYESWYQGIMPALRADLIDDHPRAFVTTTPKPIKLLIEWMGRNDGSIHTISGSTFDNAANLSPHVLRELNKRYAGTALGQQELYGKILELSGGGIFKRMDLIQHRVEGVPDDIISTVVGMDPSLTGEDDLTGIVVVARDVKDHLYVLADRTIPSAGRAAAMAAWRTVAEYGADVLAYEENLGKRYLQEVLRDAYLELVKDGVFPQHTSPPMKPIHAKHGKKTRAEPVAMRAEQGRFHMVGEWAELEDEMVTFDPESSSKESPDRMDAMVHAAIHLMAGERRRMRISSPQKYDFDLGQSFYDLSRLM